VPRTVVFINQFRTQTTNRQSEPTMLLSLWLGKKFILSLRSRRIKQRLPHRGTLIWWCINHQLVKAKATLSNKAHSSTLANPQLKAVKN